MSEQTSIGPAVATRPAGITLSILAAIGTFSALMLTNEKISKLTAEKAGDSAFTSSCDLNAWVACSAVISSPQAEAFGFPNPFIGIVGFTVVVVCGLLLALQGSMPRVFYIGLQIGVIFAAGFITWLQYQSLVNIGRLCPYCALVWAVTIPIVLIVTRLVTAELAPGTAIAKFFKNWSVLIGALWLVGVLAAIWFTFGDRLWA